MSLNKPVHLHGTVQIPGDHIITESALMISALSVGDSLLHNIHTGYTTACIANSLYDCGIRFRYPEDTNLIVRGAGLRALRRPSASLDLGPSFSGACLFTGLLLPQYFHSGILTAPVSEEPDLTDFLKPYRKMGAQFSFPGSPYHFPIAITAARLKPSKYVTESVYYIGKSALLLTGLYFPESLTVYEAIPTPDHTERILELSGASIRRTHMKDAKGRDFGDSITIIGNQAMHGFELHIPGDTCLAAYWITAGLLGYGNDITLDSMLYEERRSGFLTHCMKIGGNISITELYPDREFRSVSVHVWTSTLKGSTIHEHQLPALYEELHLIPILALFTDGPTVIEGVSSVPYLLGRRLQHICLHLQQLGAEIFYDNDALTIEPLRITTPEETIDPKQYADVIASVEEPELLLALWILHTALTLPKDIFPAERISRFYPGFFEDWNRLTGL